LQGCNHEHEAHRARHRDPARDYRSTTHH
jgi:hypothetical protein